MALPQTIGTSLEVSNTGYAGPFRASNGDHYVVLQVTTNKDVVAIYKADNGDNTWAEQDSSNRPISGVVSDRQGLSATLVGTTIHIATWGSSGSNRYVHYHAFSTSSDTWTTTEEAVAGPFSANTGDGTVSIEVRSDGDKIIFYQGPYEAIHTSNYDRIYYAVHQGTGWSDASGFLQTGQTKQYRHVYTVMGASDKVHVFYSNESNTEVEHVSFDSSNTVSAVEVVTTTSSANPLSRPFYFDDGGAETIIVGIMQGTTAYRYTVVNDGTPGGGEAVSDVAVHQDFAGAHRSFGIGADANTGKEYLAYVDSSTQDLWYDTRESGSWGTDVEELDAITGKRLCVNVYVIDSGDTVLAYVYNDNATIKYHETVVAAASSNVTVNVGTGTITSSGQAASVTPGAVSVSVNSGSLTANGQAVTVTPGAVSVSVNSGALAASGEALTVTPGAVSVAVNSGTLAASGQSVTVTPGAISVAINSGSLALSGQTVSLTSAATVNINSGTASLSGQSVTVTPGAVTVALNSGTLTTAGQAASVTPGAVSISVGTGVLSASGQPLTVTPGAVSVAVNTGSLTLSGQTVSADGGVRVSVGTGALSVSGQAVAVVPGAVSVSLASGTMAASGQAVVVTPGGVSISLSAGALSLAGQTATVNIANNVTVNVAVGALSVAGAALAVAITPSVVGYGKQAPAYVTPRVSWDDNDTVTYDEHRIRDIGKADKFVSYSTRKGGV